MSQTRFTYTIEQLLALQHSKLIKKPDELPKIEQWIDASTEQGPRRPRTQGGLQNGKGDDHEHSGKRPALFEGRQRQAQAQSGEDIFLGPKMSFASASAARQTNRRGNADEKTPSTATEESKERFDRFGNKDRARRDGFNDRDTRDEGYRSRFGRQNGFQDDDDHRGKRGDYLERGKDSRDGGVTLEGQSSRRVPASRSKFDQPWHRDGVKAESKEDRGLEDAPEGRGWRDPERRQDRWAARDTRPERDPMWMAEPALGDSGDPTQEDFQKWKEKMKAGSDPKPQTQDAPSKEAEPSTVEAADHSQSSAPVDESYFGIFGEQKRDTAKADGQPPTPKPAAKPKASRFANMFKGAQETTTTAPPDTLSPAEETSPVRSAPKNTAEDQQGFERMMQMLRMGQGSSQGPPSQLFGRPPSGSFGGDPGRGPEGPPAQDRGTLNVDPTARGGYTSPNAPQILQHGPPPGQVGVGPQRADQPQRQDQSGRDSSFLLKLMQQAPPALPEGQIYGQSYNRNEPDESNAYMGGFPSKHQEPRSRALPPGLFGNEAAFANNQNIEGPHRADGQMRQPQQMPMNERFGGPLPRHGPNEEGPMHQPPMFDQFPMNNNPRQNPQQPGHDNIPPPPGFPSARGQAPPGFFPFAGSNQPGPSPQQQFGNGPPRGPMPPSHAQQPHGYFGGPPGVPNQGLPPGFPPPPPPPPPQMPNQQQNRGQQMRPPGPDGYGDPGRRGPPPPQQQQQQPQPQPQQMQSQWPPQFLKQMGGGYQGM